MNTRFKLIFYVSTWIFLEQIELANNRYHNYIR